MASGRPKRTTLALAAAVALWTLWTAAAFGSGTLAFFGGGPAKAEQPEPKSFGLLGGKDPHQAQTFAASALAAACLAAAVAVLAARYKVLQGRILRRPYAIPDPSQKGEFEASKDITADPKAEFARIVTFLQDNIMRPIDERLPGRPFEYDLHSFPFTPMVLVIGNHSSGKSTFINKLLGKEVQVTGVAPTDDGFTILERTSASSIEDGPTVLGCPENRPFAELQRFGQIFSGHLRRKRLVLPESSVMPFGLQIIDTPGMIDLPANAGNESRGRGYNFVEVVRWWAKRSDLILLLFDPDKPGTTGETLEVLIKSLAGLNHKFLVILNKVDKLDNSVDFARAYGALGWALSKVIKRKDIPQIYTMYNSGFAHGDARTLPLDAFSMKRGEVIEEVLRVRERHNDNVITSFEESLRQIEMVAAILRVIRGRAQRRMVKLQVLGLVFVVLPALFLLQIWKVGANSQTEAAAAAEQAASAGRWSGAARAVDAGASAGSWPDLPNRWVCFGVASLYGLVCYCVACFLWEYYLQFQRLQSASLDNTFEEAYSQYFIHDDGEDLRSRWIVVRPKVACILKATPFLAWLPSIAEWELQRIKEVLGRDMWYLRQLARWLRQPTDGVESPSDA
ncbi:unnamed protein product [Polarella glacialis]|uniref:Dynamin N-terminal domain-containing protein n=1 Tax=Polarella glacialis TaxID=89957 RepID=A0A813GFZ1_POLGL|nr:unnamed protein product [Polarella glacialis]